MTGIGVRVAYGRCAALVAVLLWAGYQTFWRLTDGSVQVDEPTYVRAGWHYVHGHFRANREHPPTAKYLMGIAEVLHGGASLGAARLVVAAMSFATGLVTLFWLRRVLGWWGGLFAAATWWLLPRNIGGQPPRIDGLALLDPIMLAFAVAGLASGWWWLRRGGPLWRVPCWRRR